MEILILCWDLFLPEPETLGFHQFLIWLTSKLNKILFFASTGNWSSPAPNCIPIQCPPLFLEDPHLSLIELNTSAWGRAVFSCSWGYRLSGPPNLECLASGHWSGPIPRCRGEILKPLEKCLSNFLTYFEAQLGYGNWRFKNWIKKIGNMNKFSSISHQKQQFNVLNRLFP